MQPSDATPRQEPKPLPLELELEPEPELELELKLELIPQISPFRRPASPRLRKTQDRARSHFYRYLPKLDAEIIQPGISPRIYI
jgi:hypothetical protein